MAERNFPDNALYELDNLDVLRGMNSETVDLIATDPPFNTKRNRAGTAGFYVDNWKWGDTGVLPDQWKWNEVHPVWLEQIEDDNPALYEVVDAARACHGEDIAAFLCFLAVRLMECRRVLKPTGSIYLHCDHTASGYIRMAMDAVFGYENFRNEIVWCYTGPSNTKRWFPRKHDTIFYYVKSAAASFNPDAVRVPYKQLHVQHKEPQETGIGGALTAENVGEYLNEGKIPEDYWLEDRDKMTPVGRSSEERTGSPDQKPIALYERMVLASSKPGELVLDPFAGCATTIMAARKHGRHWVGIDRRTDARYHVVCRMAGIKAEDADKIRQRPDLADWLDDQLAKYEAHYSTEAPVRTDAGEPAAPELGPVFLPMRREQPWQRLTHAEIRGVLNRIQCLNADGYVVCVGCGRKLEEEFMELDHITPKADGGENYITNRVLLCSPCNGKKGNGRTLSGLHAGNKKDQWMKDEGNARNALNVVRQTTAQIRDEWDAPDVQALLQQARQA